MENQTSFDLTLEIQNWRRKLEQSTSMSTSTLDELESHLRDSSMALQNHGLSGEEAFHIATMRMGPREVLKTEFEKVSPPYVRTVLDLRYIGIAAILLVALVAVMTFVPILFTEQKEGSRLTSYRLSPADAK